MEETRSTRDLFAPDSARAAEIYSSAARKADPGLSPAEKNQFEKKGWVGPFPLLAPRGVRLSVGVHDRVRARFTELKPPSPGEPRKPWFKSLHAYVPEFYDMARHPALVERVSSILGPDLLAWGFSFNSYLPGKVHPWHVDVEHFRWSGVTVFLGLRNITLKSTLKVISGSQRVRKSPREMGVSDDASALAAVAQTQPDAELVPVPLGEGEFFIFDGPLWHGSKNTSWKTRYAAIIQYCRPDQKVEAPISYEPPQWHPQPPPCILVKGEDRWKVNQVVGRP